MSLIIGLNAASMEINQTSRAKGFWDHISMDKIAGKIALIHSECTELLEALRKDQGADKVSEEMADIIIRTLDLHAMLVRNGMATDNIARFIDDKMNANKLREPLHGHRWG